MKNDVYEGNSWRRPKGRAGGLERSPENKITLEESRKRNFSRRGARRYAPGIYKLAETCENLLRYLSANFFLAALARNESGRLSASINPGASRNNAAETLTNVNKIEPAPRRGISRANLAK